MLLQAFEIEIVLYIRASDLFFYGEAKAGCMQLKALIQVFEILKWFFGFLEVFEHFCNNLKATILVQIAYKRVFG